MIKTTTKITLILILSFTLHISGQTKEVTISGFVKDASSGEALIGSNILLYRDTVLSSVPYRGVASNRYGFYAFPDLAMGKYTIVFRNIGYSPYIEVVTITVSKGSMRVDAEMKTEDILLKEVVVSGHRESKAIVSEIKLTEQMLRSLPTMSGEVDIFKSLELLPGVQTASELSSGLYIRGGSPDQTLTLVDNMVIYNPSHLGNFASTFNSNAVQDIILVKGAFPAEYGGRLSSVLDIKLRSGTKEREKFVFGIGSLNSYATLEGPLSENGTYIISGRSMYYDLVQKAVYSESENPFYNFHDLNTKFTYDISDNDMLSVSSFYSSDRLYSPENLNDLNYEMSWLNGSLSLNWLRSKDKYISNTTLNYVEYHFNSRIDNNTGSIDASDYFASSKLRDFVFGSDFEIFAHPDHKIKTGIQIMYHKYNLIASDIYDISLETDSDLRTKVNSLETSVYLQAESQISSRLKTNIGARLYYFKNQKKLSVEPRASFLFSILDNLSLKGAFSIGHQYLHLMSRNDISLPSDFWYPSTSVINPSRSTQYVVGLESSFLENLLVISVEGYYRDMKDIYEFKQNAKFRPSTPVDELLTIGQGEAYGIEIFINKTTGNLTGWIGYTYAYTKRLFDELNFSKIYYPRYDRRHDVSFVLAYKFSDNFSASTTWTYASGQGITMPYGQFRGQKFGNQEGSELLLLYSERNGHRLPAYHKLDLSLSYKVEYEKSDITFYLTLFNVYNRQNIFAQYLAYKSVVNSETGLTDTIPQVKQIVLFPFIPTFGLKVNL